MLTPSTQVLTKGQVVLRGQVPLGALWEQGRAAGRAGDLGEASITLSLSPVKRR